jgi:hypothetical protein
MKQRVGEESRGAEAGGDPAGIPEAVEGGDKECPQGKRNRPARGGRAAKPKGRNPPDRLVGREGEVLGFMRRKEVPFTNNQAERDLRMIKVRKKASGCFRTWVRRGDILPDTRYLPA